MDISASIMCVEIIKELLESSSSSDEEVFLELVKLNHQPSPKGFVDTVIKAYSEADFKKHLRLSRKCATYLIGRYSQSYSKRNYSGGRIQTSVETQLLSFLWFSGNRTTYREVANLFDMSLSNVHRCINSVFNFLVDDLGKEVIKFPRLEEEMEKIAHDFEKVSGVPNILGCIGRSYIAIKTPKCLARSKHLNKQKKMSITLQGICDSQLRFLDVFTGIYCKSNGSEVLQDSLIGKELASLCRSKFYVLGDSTYSIREYLLTPYPDSEELRESEENFNIYFHRSRVKIENAFRILKCRFRQLTRMSFNNVKTMEKFITACCVLHNICIERHENLPEEIFSNEFINSVDQPVESGTKDLLLIRAGELKREQIKNLLFNTGN